MSLNLSERARIVVSGLAAGTITSLLMFTVAEALNPHHLIQSDASAVLAVADAPLATVLRRDA